MMNAIILIMCYLLVLLMGKEAAAESAERVLPRCLYVASYHHGYSWQDDMEQSIRTVLKGKCELKQFNMDSKRNPDIETCKQKALEAKALIDSWKPDVVIASDDNASRYLVVPYFKNEKLPIVFCGVNFTVEEYGYPFPNVTGMIETIPFRPLATFLKRSLPEAKTAVCLTPDRYTEKKNSERFRQYFSSRGVDVSIRMTRTMDEFEKEYLAAQEADFLLLMNNYILEDWDEHKVKRFLLQNSSKLTITYGSWMAAYAMLTMDTQAREHGEYAARVAMKIMSGARPSDFPIIANREWNIYLNEGLLNAAGIRLPGDLVHKAEKVE